jgi:pyrrolidone-carboxylate peptidase
MIRVLTVAFAPAPGRRASVAQQALAVLKVEAWAPRGTAVQFMTAPCAWWGAADAIFEAAQSADAVVLLGATDAATAQTPRYARNEADPSRADALGLRWPGGVLAPGAPLVMRTTLPALGLAQALTFAGLPTEAPPEACRFTPNRCLFDLTLRAPEKPSGLILLPMTLEAGRQEGLAGRTTRLDVLAGVRAALTFAAAAAEVAHASEALIPCQASGRRRAS